MLVRAKGGEAVPQKELDKMKSLISNFEFYEMSQSDHCVYKSDPDEFYSYFDKFLSKL
jgi:hypothetical protein